MTERSSESPSAQSESPAASRRRKPALLVIATLCAAAGIGYGAWWFQVQRHQESTDNAYVHASVVQVTPEVGGTIVAVDADDTEHVEVGQRLAALDTGDARIALTRAEAQLAQAVREVRSLYAGNRTLDAGIALRETEVARAETALRQAEDDAARREPLAGSGAISGEEVRHAQAAVDAARRVLSQARAALAVAQRQAAGGRVLTDGTALSDHPAVMRAAAAVREAYLTLSRCEVRAPLSGQIVRRTVQVGQRVAAGAPLMAVVPLERVWVEANFKESQLRRMRLGQAVALHADLYGEDVAFHGRIVGFGAGTGAAFALLPAQNATGNWIKIVQRVPVRVALDPRELQIHPLRMGLSMQATVDLDSVPVNAPPPTRAEDESALSRPDSSAVLAEADQRVAAIVAAHLGTQPGNATPGAKANGNPPSAAKPAAPRQGAKS